MAVASIRLSTRQDDLLGRQMGSRSVSLPVPLPCLYQPTVMGRVRALKHAVYSHTRDALLTVMLFLTIVVGLVLVLAASILGCLAGGGNGALRAYHKARSILGLLIKRLEHPERGTAPAVSH